MTPDFWKSPTPARDDADYMRAALSLDGDGRTVATPFQNQDSSLLSVLSASGALLIRPPLAPAAKAGQPCVILKLPF